MTTQAKIFSNGTVVAKSQNGEIKKIAANSKEALKYYASKVPKIMKGAKLVEISYNLEEQSFHTKYDDGKSYRKRFAQTESGNKEPLDSGDRAESGSGKSEKVAPRDEKKSKPQTLTPEDVGRKDVHNPDKVRDGNYGRGEKGKDLHTDVVPRSKNDSGLKGHKATSFEKEKAEDATSGKPNSYVQKWEPSPKPTPTSSEMNHTAASNAKTTAMKEEECECEEGDKTGKKTEKSESGNKDKEKKKEFPFFSKKKEENKKDSSKSEKAADEDKKAESSRIKSQLKEAKYKLAQKEQTIKQLNEKLAEQDSLTNELKESVNEYKLREARQKEAIKHALLLRDLHPATYGDDESFVNKIDEVVRKMPTETIVDANLALADLRIEASRANRKPLITASNNAEAISTPIQFPRQEQFQFTPESKESKLKNILSQESSIARRINADNYSD